MVNHPQTTIWEYFSKLPSIEQANPSPSRRCDFQWYEWYDICDQYGLCHPKNKVPLMGRKSGLQSRVLLIVNRPVLFVSTFVRFFKGIPPWDSSIIFHHHLGYIFFGIDTPKCSNALEYLPTLRTKSVVSIENTQRNESNSNETCKDVTPTSWSWDKPNTLHLHLRKSGRCSQNGRVLDPTWVDPRGFRDVSY